MIDFSHYETMFSHHKIWERLAQKENILFYKISSGTTNVHSGIAIDEKIEKP